MRVTFISPYSDISSLGIRSLSACLKKARHQTNLIFLPELDDMLSPDGMSLEYSKRTLDQVVGLCDGSDFIGISLMTNYFDKGVQLSCHLESKLDIPIIWGGVHPTVKPEESLRYADIVCIGEAEEAFLELVEKKEAGEDITCVKGFWFRKNGELIRNPIRPLNEDLDSLPFFDYSLENHYVLRGGLLEPMDSSVLAEFLAQNNLPGIRGKPCYQTITARGCPHNCSYCCNNVYWTLYQGQRYLRRRSADNIIEELKTIKNKFDFIEAVQFSDDVIFATTESTIEEFARLYKRDVNLPFYCLGHPATITQRKMKNLVDAGLKCIQIGIETGSERTKKVYMRSFSNKKILEMVGMINKFHDRILPPIYDFIVDNPYETDEDLVQTIQLILQFPAPYELNIFSLVLFPGTDLYKKALKDAYIKDEVEQVYRKRMIDRQESYTNLLLSLLRQRHIPRAVLRILSHRKIVKILNNNRLSWLVKLVYFSRAVFGRIRT